MDGSNEDESESKKFMPRQRLSSWCELGKRHLEAEILVQDCILILYDFLGASRKSGDNAGDFGSSKLSSEESMR